MSTTAKIASHPRRQDLTGKRFGRLIAVQLSPIKIGPRHPWVCDCDCGTKGRLVLPSSLRSGNTTSCGCVNTERIGLLNKTHGMTKSAEHHAWANMLARCRNPNGLQFSDYGGRGISVCERWSNSFESFLEDMGPRPSPQHSVDRIDNNKGYDPKNCRWATKKEQNRNKNNNRLVTLEGLTMTVSGWSERTGIRRSTLANRLNRGWGDQKALTTPVGQNHSKTEA